MSKYQAYPEYKDSNISGLGLIPKSWEIMQLKRTVDGCVNGIWGSEPRSAGDDTIVLRVADFDRPRLSIKETGYTFRYIDEKEKASRKLKRGDLLLEKSGGGEKTLVGQVVLFEKDFEAVTSNFVAKMTPLDGFNSKFLNYVFSRFYSDRINFCSIKQNTGIQNLDSAAYLAEKFGFPQENEQAQIAAFLDHETAKIDTLIDKQQQLIQLLKEKRQAVISHAVTKGLNPNAPVRDSGVEWLGEVPEHWKVGRYKFCTSRVVVGIAEAATHAYAETGVPIIRSTNIREEGLDLSGMLFIKKGFAELNSSKYLYTNDVITVRTGYPGTSAVIPETLDKSQCFTNLVATPKEEMSPHFLSEYLNSHTGKSYFDLLGWGSAQKNISVPILQNISIAWPEISEQKEIVSYIQQQREKYTKLVTKGEKQIELLQERRTALISAAVTGKIDVRNWSPA
ncbi:restriction endonuclease subunit S [Pseudomonas sp. C27(2019)]|uniref:restriction endonuclease subunit S n=1 Tax=Pseudomonas sp. C27(2019) TaxID=2604941 RepID=UPI00124433EA|nr:restriction endonuclease subunit S [Pseudomonas sp. C27(2019)]QEY59102.1 restriction endonuclease subunit S [Pseudomonas sp. C27(2019)]